MTTSTNVHDSILDVGDIPTFEEFYIDVDNVQSTSLITPDKKMNRKLAKLIFLWYNNLGANRTPLHRNGMTAIAKKQKKEEKKDMRHIIVNHVDNLKPDLL